MKDSVEINYIHTCSATVWVTDFSIFGKATAVQHRLITYCISGFSYTHIIRCLLIITKM